MRVSIYEPDPRICGPGTWARHLRQGFRDLGHECDVVTFTRLGKRSPNWGRIEKAKGSSMSCSLVPDVCAKLAEAHDVLNSYDLVVLADVKTSPLDNAALKDPMLDEPTYLTVLRKTRTKWASALHERWYFAPPDPVPPGVSERSGSPFINELLALDSFSGFVMAHSADFDKYCGALQRCRKVLRPLPFSLEHSEAQAMKPRDPLTFAVIGRMVPTKHRHVTNEMLTRGMLKNAHAHYGGGCVCTHGPSDTYVMQERLGQDGWATDWGDDGVRKTKPFEAWHENGNVVEYHGAYVDPYEVLQHARCHVGITDCDFSGGLLEFATLEAIDCGCLPIVTRPFVPDFGTQCELGVIEREFRKFGHRACKDESNALYEEMAELVADASRRWGADVIQHNRECIRVENDPREQAKTLIEGAL